MKNTFLFPILLLSILISCKNETVKQPEQAVKQQMVFTSDIDNFWEAHDKIRSTQDSTKHLQILKEFFLDKGTPGLPAIIEARRYKPQEYVDAINNYPLLWKSIRKNIQLSKGLSKEIDNGIERLKAIYPDLKPAQIYLTVGVFRTGGTTIDDKVLIGVETAFGDKHVDVSELPDSLGYIKKYWATKDGPVTSFALTNVHEYIHTQQIRDFESNLLSIALYEGIAEYVSTLALGLEQSDKQCVIYGKKHNEKVRTAFEQDMFSKDYGFWLWNDQENEFATRDLAYYIGYAMAEKHYQNSENKLAAIKEMIELDHFNEAEIETFAGNTGYFPKPIEELKKLHAAE